MSQLLAGLLSALTDRYALDREVGEGRMATVYLAHDVPHDRKVALKVLRPELGAVLGVQRFLAEIKTTANLQHFHLLPLFNSREAEGHLFYVMDLGFRAHDAHAADLQPGNRHRAGRFARRPPLPADQGRRGQGRRTAGHPAQRRFQLVRGAEAADGWDCHSLMAERAAAQRKSPPG